MHPISASGTKASGNINNIYINTNKKDKDKKEKTKKLNRWEGDGLELTDVFGDIPIEDEDIILSDNIALNNLEKSEQKSVSNLDRDVQPKEQKSNLNKKEIDLTKSNFQNKTQLEKLNNNSETGEIVSRHTAKNIDEQFSEDDIMQTSKFKKIIFIVFIIFAIILLTITIVFILKIFGIF